MIGTSGIMQGQPVEPTWFTIAGKEHYEKNRFKKCLCELSVVRVGGCGFHCVDFLFEFRAERGALDSCGARGLSGQATVFVPCSHQHVAEDASEALASSLPKDGRSHTRDQAICDCCSRTLSLHVSQTGGAQVVKGPSRYWCWIICITIFGTTDT